MHSSTPELILVGHKVQGSSFALDWAKTSNRIASGAGDGKLLIWDLEDINLINNFGTNKRELTSI